MRCPFHSVHLAKEDEISDRSQNDHVQQESDGEDPERSQVAFGLITHGMIRKPVGKWGQTTSPDRVSYSLVLGGDIANMLFQGAMHHLDHPGSTSLL